MVFSSPIFLFAFLPAVLAGYYLLDRRFKNGFLLIVSLLFYAWGEPKFVLVMIVSILVNHAFALAIDRDLKRAQDLAGRSTGDRYRKRAKTVLVLAVLFDLALFFVYKYLDFTIANLNAVGALFGAPEIPLRHIALPIGISFFTFQAMSYVFDVYLRKGRVQKDPLDTALYIALFPQLIAGPIVRYETVAEEINRRQETLEDVAKGIRRFIVGLAKKVILSNSVAVIADQAFGWADPSGLSVLMAWLGAVAYTLQIYFDFSGYSDMAIGLGLMFGFHFDENFDYPYISKSVSEFWRRWHISLSSWFRDYVYIPLGGSRVEGRARHIRNLFVVWFLTGFWHGAAWNFVAWGMFYFVLIVFEKLTGMPQRLERPAGRYVYQAAVLAAVTIGWVLFRADGARDALRYVGCMFGLLGNPGVDPAAVFLCKQSAVLLAAAMLFSTPVVPKLTEIVDRKVTTLGGGVIAREALSIVLHLALFLVGVSFAVTSDYDPFIYFNF